MYFDSACIPCIIKQAYNSVKMFSDGDKTMQLQIMQEVCSETSKIQAGFTAPKFSRTIQSVMQKYFRQEDLYKDIKEANLIKIEKYLSYIENLLEDGQPDIRFEIAIRAAIVGNIIDYGAKPDYNIELEINRMFSDNVDLSLLDRFRRDYEKAELILYIADNFEEALFDKFLLKEFISKNTVFAVRSKPILNDITLQDAEKLEINKICTVLESGSTIAGTDLSECTEEFMDLYNRADLVIAKGQGNYETLIDESRPIYFMFKVKCPAISERCDYPIGKGILLFNQI